MIYGLGLDLCDISRILKAISREHFIDRVYTAREGSRIRSASDARRGEIAAGLFAAKEAVAKALGTGFSRFGPADIEIVPDEAGRPTCTLYNGARARAEALCSDYQILVTITHESGTAAAVAIFEGRDIRP